MITNPKKQLFNSNGKLLFFAGLFLAVPFVWAFQQLDFYFQAIAPALLIVLIYLAYLRVDLIHFQSATDLKIQDLREKINLLQADIANEYFALEAWEKKIEIYSQLKDLTEKFCMSVSLHDTSKIISREVSQFFSKPTMTTVLYYFEKKNGELALISSRREGRLVNVKTKKGDVFDWWVIKSMQALLVEDARSDFRFDIEKVEPEDRRNVLSLISVPLVVRGILLGLMRVDDAEAGSFTTEDLRFFRTIGDLVTVAMENAQLYEQVEEMAIKDSLTGLYLRRYLLERLNEEINRQFRRKKPLSFLMIDLDRFKKYNDRYGHMAGDIVLRTIALILKEYFEAPGNLVCRYGGEEFAVLLPDYSKGDAGKLAEELRKKIQKQEIILRQQKTHITVSIGVSSLPDDTVTQNELIHFADQAMYQAKKQGRNRVCSYS